MKKLLSFVGVLIVLSGCNGNGEEEQENAVETKVVPALMVQAIPFKQTVTVSGTLEPKFESAVSAEISGTVSQVYANEGSAVFPGQQLLALAATGNVASVDVSAGQTALQNAERSLELTRQQTTEAEKNAELAVQQAQKNLENARKTDTSTGSSVEAQVASAQSGVELAQIGLENSEKSLANLQENLKKQESDLQENEENVISGGITTFRSVLQQADEILGATDANERKNDRFETYLGFRNKQTLIDSKNSFLLVWNDFKNLESRYASNPSSVTSTELVDIAQAVRDTLRQVDIMLQNTITGGSFTAAELTGFRTSTTTNRSTLESIFQSITAIDQQISDFEITKPQQLRSAEIGVEQAQKQLAQAEKALEQSKSGGDVSLVGTSNQISTAENALETAQTQLEITRRQNELSIQQAATARDSARNSLQRSQTQYSKLSVAAPVNGVITSAAVEVGDTVSIGAPLFVIAQVDVLTLRGDVSIEVLPSIKKGAPVIVEIDVYGEREGFVSNIFPVADATTRRVTIKISLDNTDGSIPANIFATAVIELPQDEEVILIPFKSLTSQQPPSVFVVGEAEREDGFVLMVEKRLVETGRKEGNQIEIVNGVAVGEIIVPGPVVSLQDGDLVEFYEEDEALPTPQATESDEANPEEAEEESFRPQERNEQEQDAESVGPANIS